MTRMLDAHHPGLGTHVEAVSTLAGKCAEALGLSTEEVETVERAAELHDIGKVAIPSEILTERGPVGDEERAFIRRHSIIGERILGGVPSLERVASMVRSSHERWDGGGYPDGLAGDEIPIGARIILVADAFCAMTETRPYAEADRSRARARSCVRAQERSSTQVSWQPSSARSTAVASQRAWLARATAGEVGGATRTGASLLSSHVRAPLCRALGVREGGLDSRTCCRSRGTGLNGDCR